MQGNMMHVMINEIRVKQQYGEKKLICFSLVWSLSRLIVFIILFEVVTCNYNTCDNTATECTKVPIIVLLPIIHLLMHIRVHNSSTVRYWHSVVGHNKF